MKFMKKMLCVILSVLMIGSTMIFAGAENETKAADAVTGFTDEDFDNVIKNNPEVHRNSRLFPRDKLIRTAGNSIPVKLLEGIFYQVIKIDKIINS